MNREERIQQIVNGNIEDDDFLRHALSISREEEDDLIRAMARCYLQEKSLLIMDRLLK